MKVAGLHAHYIKVLWQIAEKSSGGEKFVSVSRMHGDRVSGRITQNFRSFEHRDGTGLRPGGKSIQNNDGLSAGDLPKQVQSLGSAIHELYKSAGIAKLLGQLVGKDGARAAVARR